MTNSKKRNFPKVIIYELNEVPRKLFDFYVEQNPKSAFAKIEKEGLILNTYTNDQGELHPWSTWPTVHRGVNNNIHNIRFINQDLNLSNIYKPVWEILTKNGIDVGVFGSLQSYPPIKNKNYKFYLPDTFSPSPEAYPKPLSEFQKLNLDLARENKAVSRNIKKNNIKDVINLIKKGVISKRSLIRLAIHLIKEKINPKYKNRRSTMQNVLSFPIYFKYLNKYKPSFSTYFTNHVAGMMHRYWKDLFPEDFVGSLTQKDKFHSKSIINAMHLANNDLKQLIKFSNKNNYNLWVISSMGQEAIYRGNYIPELLLINFEKFISALGLNCRNYRLVPAMQPDYCIVSKNKEALKNIREKIKYLTDDLNEQILKEKYPPVGLSLNLSMQRSDNIAKSRNCKLKSISIDIEQLGLELIKRDIGTGYHIPEGIFGIYGKEINISNPNKKQLIDTCQITPTILDIYGIDLPSYMKKPL